MVSGQLCQSKAFSIIDTSLENDIDLGWNLLLFHGTKPVQYLWKLVISGDLSIDIRVKSIQADIDSVKSLAAEAFCIVGKKDTIGRQRYLINAWNLTDHTDQTVTAVSDKRLASGYFDLADTKRRSKPADFCNLFQRQ